MAHTIFGIAIFTSGQVSRAFSHCGIFERKMSSPRGTKAWRRGAESVHKADALRVKPALTSIQQVLPLILGYSVDRHPSLILQPAYVLKHA